MCDGDFCEDGGCDVESSLKRSLPDGAHHLEERVPNRPAGAATQKELFLAAGVKLLMTTAPYPSDAKLFEGLGARTLAMKGGFMMADTVCTNLGVSYHKAGNIPTGLLAISGRPILWATEHRREVSLESVCVDMFSL
jgi:chitinase